MSRPSYSRATEQNPFWRTSKMRGVELQRVLILEKEGVCWGGEKSHAYRGGGTSDMAPICGRDGPKWQANKSAHLWRGMRTPQAWPEYLGRGGEVPPQNSILGISANVGRPVVWWAQPVQFRRLIAKASKLRWRKTKYSLKRFQRNTSLRAELNDKGLTNDTSSSHYYVSFSDKSNIWFYVSFSDKSNIWFSLTCFHGTHIFDRKKSIRMMVCLFTFLKSIEQQNFEG